MTDQTTRPEIDPAVMEAWAKVSGGTIRDAANHLERLRRAGFTIEWSDPEIARREFLVDFMISRIHLSAVDSMQVAPRIIAALDEWEANR